MKKKILLGIILLSLMTSFAYGQDQSLQRSELNSPLALTIKSDKEVYEIGEEIIVDMEFTNVGKESFYLNTWIFIHPHMLEAIVQGPDGVVEKTFHIRYDMLPYLKKHYILLAPGESYVTKIHTDKPDDYYPYHFLGHEVKKPGTYTIAVIYENEVDSYFIPGGRGPISVPNVWLGRITSNTITIEVKEKKKTDLPESLSFLSDIPEFQEFRFQMSEQEIREIVRKNPLILEGNSQKGFFVTNKDGETLALPMVNGRCSGIQRLSKQPRPIQLTIKSYKQMYGVGEDVRILLNLENNSEKQMIFNWRYGGVMSEELNVLEVIIFGDENENTETIYIDPKKACERIIILKYNTKMPLWFLGKCFITLRYFPPTVLDYKLHEHLSTQEIWTKPLASNTITIELVEKEKIKQFNNLFQDKFSQIKVGMNKEQVISQLDRPFKKSIDTLPTVPFWGPQESLVNIISPGSEYEEWEYGVNDTTYLIWFGSVDIVPKDRWKVIEKANYPIGAVF